MKSIIKENVGRSRGSDRITKSLSICDFLFLTWYLKFTRLSVFT
nr:Hypothetical protein [Escherichia coli]